MEVKPGVIEGRGLFSKVILRPRQKSANTKGNSIRNEKGAKTQKWFAILEGHNGKSIDVDKETTGSRFINHSCAPNAFHKILGEQAEFYALHSIEAGRELTLDYGDSHHDGKLPCTLKPELPAIYLTIRSGSIPENPKQSKKDTPCNAPSGKTITILSLILDGSLQAIATKKQRHSVI